MRFAIPDGVKLDRRAFGAGVGFLLAASVARVARARPQLKTLAGSFTQERTIGLLKSVVRSRGVFALVRPDRLRWELLPPDEIVYWVTPDALAYRSRDGRGRVPRGTGRLGPAMEDLRGLLTGEVAALKVRYDVRETPADPGLVIDATPKEPAKAPFQKLTLELGADLVRPVRATLVENAKDRTVITFVDLVVDGPIDPKLLEPPA